MVLSYGSNCAECMGIEQRWKEAGWSSYAHGFGKNLFVFWLLLILHCFLHCNCSSKRVLITHSFVVNNNEHSSALLPV